VAAGQQIAFAAPTPRNVPKRATAVTHWYVAGRLVHTGGKLVLQSTWKGKRLVARTKYSWSQTEVVDGVTETVVTTTVTRSRPRVIR